MLFEFRILFSRVFSRLMHGRRHYRQNENQIDSAIEPISFQISNAPFRLASRR